VNGLDRDQRRRNEGEQVLDRVAQGAEHDDAQASIREALLVLEVLVAGQEHRKASGLGVREQRPVLEASQACCWTVRTSCPTR
jgi:hypothetical protein